MYECYDIDLPRFFVADALDVHEGEIDPSIKPGFECFISPYLDTELFSMRKIVDTLVKHDCSFVYIPMRIVMRNKEYSKALNNAPLDREFVTDYPIKRVAEKTVGSMDHDLVFICEDIEAKHGSAAELYEWVYGEHHPYKSEVIEESTTELDTPLGKVTVMGPEKQLAPFKVTRLLNAHYPHGETRAVNFVDYLYRLEVNLDDLVDNADYYVGINSIALHFEGSDERTECFTCVEDGIAFGIGVWDPSDDWDSWPGYDPTKFMGYFVKTNHGEPNDRPICITPVPLSRDKIKKAELTVGWLDDWGEPREPWSGTEDILDYFLT